MPKEKKPKQSEAKPQPQPEPLPTKRLTRAQWLELPSLQLRLRSVLEDPAFELACETLLHMAMPSAQPVVTLQPGVSAEAMIYADATRYHNRSGFTQFKRALFSLARPKDVSRRGSEWGDVDPNAWE